MAENFDVKDLITQALEVQKLSYSPYSNFQVGAALLGKSGKVYTGCNVENAAYSPCNCGERTAFFKAVSEGEREFTAIAIVGKAKDADVGNYCAPCGVCRQVMAEFCDLDSFSVIMAKTEDEYKISTLGEVLPMAFTPKDLGK